MASIFDMFGGSPQSQGLLAAAAQILQASGPSRTPTGLGQILGGGLAAYQQTEQQARQLGQQEQFNALRTRALQADLTKDERALADQQRLIDFYSKRGAPDGATPPLDTRVQAPPIGSMGRPAGALTTGTNATQTWFEKQMAEADELERAGLVPRADAIRKQAIAFRGKAKWENVKNGDKVSPMPLYEDGTRGDAVDAAVAQNLNWQDTGQETVGLDPTFGTVVARQQNTVSPNTAASNAVTVRGQDKVDARQRDANEIARMDKQKAMSEARAGQVASFETMLGTLDRLETHKGLPRSVGLYSKAPTLPGSDSANFQAELETFKSQAFIPMVAQLKGMGALSDAEGKKLSAAVGALDTKMGEKAFKASIKRIQADMGAAYERASGKKWSPAREVTRTGMYNGRKVVQYSDGSTEYAD